jgi:hypothetical protein
VPNRPDDELLDAFVSAFTAFDDMLVGDSEQEVSLAIEELGEIGPPSMATTT